MGSKYKTVTDEICSMLDTYRGRDKILRTFCYSARLIGGLSNDKDVSEKFLCVSRQLSNTRTTLRLFDDLPMLKYTIEYGLGKEENNYFMASLGVLSNIIDQLFYPIEKVTWLAEHKLITSVNSDKWNTASSICWIASVYLSLIKTLRHLAHLRKHIENCKKCNGNTVEISLNILLAKQRFEVLTCLRLFLDLVHAVNTLPKGVLWSSKLNTWQVGLVGTLSSLLGVYQFIAKKNL